jgi:hypothetical protein
MVQLPWVLHLTPLGIFVERGRESFYARKSENGKWKTRGRDQSGRRGSLHRDPRISRGLDRRSKWLWSVPIRLTATGVDSDQWESVPLPAWRQPLLASSLLQDKKWHDSGRKWGQNQRFCVRTPDRVWRNHCSSNPRVQRKHPILRLPSGHAGDSSPSPHPDWGLARSSFRPSKATAPHDRRRRLPLVPRVGNKRDLPCPLSSEYSQKKRQKTSYRSSHPTLDLQVTIPWTPSRTPMPRVVVTASKQTTHRTSNSYLPRRPHNFIRFATESVLPLTSHATSPGLTVKSRRPGPML